MLDNWDAGRQQDGVRRAGAISNSAALRGVAVAALALPDLRFEREWPATPDITLANLDPAFERIALCRGAGPVENGRTIKLTNAAWVMDGPEIAASLFRWSKV